MNKENLDLNKIDMQFVQPVYGNICGPHNVRLLYYRNIHPTTRIRIFVHHHYLHNNQQVSQSQQYVLYPNPKGEPDKPNSLDVIMGCPIPGPTMQRFHWDIDAAEWA